MITPDLRAYAPHQLLTEPARPSAQLWRVIVGFILIMIVMYGLLRSILFLCEQALGEQAAIIMMDALNHADTPWAMLSLLGLMGLMGLSTFVIAETVHGRSAISLLGPMPLALGQFWHVFRVLVPLGVGVQILTMGQPVVPGLAFDAWLPLFPIALIALLIQTGSEEILFRGYLQPALATRFKHPLVWLLIPSVIFALGHHSDETYGANAWMVTAWAMVFGMLAGDLTARSGTLGPAIAFHLANNLFAITVTALAGDMSGLALRHIPIAADNLALRPLLYVDFAVMIISWLAARLALRR
jgi:membrane protease YdiL (CAAX protease family)